MLAALGVGLALTGCGGAADLGAVELGTEVNAVEAALAIDDVQVAGAPLTRRAAPAPAAAGAEAAGSAVSATGPGTQPVAAGRVPAHAHLPTGAPLRVDLEVADATRGSEVTVVWSDAAGRPVWKGLRTVGDEPRLAFAADTEGWPVGLYTGEIFYGTEKVHRFAVQVGSAPPPVVARMPSTTATGRGPVEARTGAAAEPGSAPAAPATPIATAASTTTPPPAGLPPEQPAPYRGGPLPPPVDPGESNPGPQPAPAQPEPPPAGPEPGAEPAPEPDQESGSEPP